MSYGKYSDNYKSFIKRRDILICLIEQQMSLLTALGMENWVATLQSLKTRVSTNLFKVLVIGEFKRGKSTFINALLGQEILPAYSEPCTAIISEIKWGESPRAILHYSDQSEDSNTKVKEVSVEKLDEYITIPLFNNKNTFNPHDRYKKIDIIWPLELCRNGIELIDSPGLNENQVRSDITQSYLPIVDATLFVLSCDVLASQSELRTIEIMRTIGHQDIFFIANKFDTIREREQERFKKYALSKLTPLTRLGQDGVFFMSAIYALDGRIDKDEQKIINSGILNFEKKLESFLTTDRGRIKIVEPAKVLKESIRVAQYTVPARKAMLNTDRNELEIRYQNAQEPLRLLEVKQIQIEQRIFQFCEDLGNLVETKAYDFYGLLAKQVEDWVKNYELKSEVKITINVFKIEESINDQVKDIVKELSEHLIEKIENEFINWQKKELEPFLSSRVESLKIDLDARASEFIKEVEELRFQLAGNGTPPEAIKNALERLLLASVIATSKDTSVKGIKLENVIGYGSTITNVAAAIGAFFSIASSLGIIIGFIVPLVLPVAVIAFETYRRKASPEISRKVEKQIREKTSSKFVEEINKIRKVSAKQIAKDIIVDLEKIKGAINEGLNQEINNLKDQVATVLSEKEKGETNVAQKLDELEEIAETLKVIDDNLDDLLVQFIQI